MQLISRSFFCCCPFSSMSALLTSYPALHPPSPLSPSLSVCPAPSPSREQLQELYEKQQSNRSIAERWRGVQGESVGEKKRRTSHSSLGPVDQDTTNTVRKSQVKPSQFYLYSPESQYSPKGLYRPDYYGPNDYDT